MQTFIKLILLPNLIFFFTFDLRAESLDEKLNNNIDAIESKWATTYYSDNSNDDKKKIYDDLIILTDKLAKEYPDKAEPLIWKGILLSNVAGVISSFSALKKVDEARKQLELSIDLIKTQLIKSPLLKTELKRKAAYASAYTNLALLYDKVPGGIISFGSDTKAQELYELAIKTDPDAIDANLYFGEFLLEKDKKPEAISYFKKVLNIEPRPKQIFADNKLKLQAKKNLKELEVNPDEYMQISKESMPASAIDAKDKGSK